MGLSSVMNLYNGNILCNFNKFSISFIQIILGNIDFLKQNRRFAVKIPDMLPYILLLGVKNIKSKTIKYSDFFALTTNTNNKKKYFITISFK